MEIVPAAVLQMAEALLEAVPAISLLPAAIQEEAAVPAALHRVLSQATPLWARRLLMRDVNISAIHIRWEATA